MCRSSETNSEAPTLKKKKKKKNDGDLLYGGRAANHNTVTQV